MNIIKYAMLKKMLGGSSNGGGSGATAYHLRSVDELPANAVNGSLAICTAEKVVGYLGKWLFDNDILDLTPANVPTDSKIIFSSNEQQFVGFIVLTVGSDAWGIYQLAYSAPNDGLYQSAYIYNPSNNYGITHGWNNEAYKTINVTEADAEAIKWVEAHGTLIEQGDPITETITALYARENGEWVYKGEVV